MKRVVFVIYRKWVFEIVKRIADFNRSENFFDISAIITTPEHEFLLKEAKRYCKIYVVNGNNNANIFKILKRVQANVAFFYGWSWIVKKEIIDNFLCLALHPSPLPKYRGGTPIQHQILAGETNSAVTVFKMSEGIDNGDIYKQLPMSLRGDLNDIFSRMSTLGIRITKQFLLDLNRGIVKFVHQKNLYRFPPLKRRKFQDSEIKLASMKDLDFNYIYNLVRGLLDPYPNAYISLPGKQIKVLKVNYFKEPTCDALVLKSEASLKHDLYGKYNDIFLKLKDGYAKLLEYKIAKI